MPAPAKACADASPTPEVPPAMTTAESASCWMAWVVAMRSPDESMACGASERGPSLDSGRLAALMIRPL